VRRIILPIYVCSVLLVGVWTTGCKTHGGKSHEIAYVSAPQTFLRDRVATVYNKVTTVKNGDRLDVLERTTNRRFVHVRTIGGVDGWVEQRSLVGDDVFQAFQKLAKDNAAAPEQARSTTHAETNLHLAPGRDTDHLYQLPQGGKLSVLRRAFAEKALPGAAPRTKSPPTGTSAKDGEKDKEKNKEKNKEKDADAPDSPGAEPEDTARSSSARVGPKPILEDWLLVRDSEGRVGWVLARLVDFDIPLEIAQYSEGQRMAAFFVLTEVPDRNTDGVEKKVPEYVVLFTESKDGQPFDFNQVRVFTWNGKRHRYETAYREHKLNGVLPASVSREEFGKEGTLPTFTIHVRDDEDKVIERKYKLNGPIVRLVKP
jgi:SH3-like domain-containing protein